MVIPDLDVAQANIDHFALFASVNGPRPQAHRHHRVRKSNRVDWSKVRQRRDADTWNEIFKDLPQPSWQTDVHDHWQACRDNLVAKLAQTFPAQKSRPRKPFISDEVWRPRNQKQSLRRQAALHAHLCLQLDLLVSIRAWCNGQRLAPALLHGFLWAMRCIAAHLCIGPELRAAQQELRSALALQRQAFLERIAEEADHAPGSQTFAIFRKAGFTSTRKRTARPLPAIRLDDGTPAQDHVQIKTAWRHYFASIECGHQITPPQLLQLCAYTEAEAFQRPSEKLLRALPPLRDLEASLRRCKAKRAAGPDLLPP